MKVVLFFADVFWFAVGVAFLSLMTYWTVTQTMPSTTERHIDHWTISHSPEAQ